MTKTKIEIGRQEQHLCVCVHDVHLHLQMTWLCMYVLYMVDVCLCMFSMKNAFSMQMPHLIDFHHMRSFVYMLEHQ